MVLTLYRIQKLFNIAGKRRPRWEIKVFPHFFGTFRSTLVESVNCFLQSLITDLNISNQEPRQSGSLMVQYNKVHHFLNTSVANQLTQKKYIFNKTSTYNCPRTDQNDLILKKYLAFMEKLHLMEIFDRIFELCMKP